MKAFITGGAGFIGSHLADRLVNEASVTVYDDLSSGKLEYINQDCKFIQDDVLSLRTLVDAMKYHDTVFHLAANPDVRRGICNTRLDLEQETIATHCVLESMRVNRIKKIVFISSSTVYGDSGDKYVSEANLGNLPVSLYGAGKLSSESFISAYCELFNMQAWIFRIANIVGPRVTHGVIFDFVKKLREQPTRLEVLGNGKQSKPYLHVDDCVDGILFGHRNAKDRVNIFNLGCATVTSVKTIANMVVAAMKLHDTAINYGEQHNGWRGDVPHVRMDCTKMRELGWSARFTSDNAVERAIKEIVGATHDIGLYSCT